MSVGRYKGGGGVRENSRGGGDEREFECSSASFTYVFILLEKYEAIRNSWTRKGGRRKASCIHIHSYRIYNIWRQN
jgi:hypothetical protein